MFRFPGLSLILAAGLFLTCTYKSHKIIIKYEFKSYWQGNQDTITFHSSKISKQRETQKQLEADIPCYTWCIMPAIAIVSRLRLISAIIPTVRSRHSQFTICMRVARIPVTNAISRISSADLTDVVTTETRASNVFLIHVGQANCQFTSSYGLTQPEAH